MPDAAFNPDQYLAEKSQANTFNPDQYLAEKSPPPADVGGAAKAAGSGIYSALTAGASKPYLAALRAGFGQSEKMLRQFEGLDPKDEQSPLSWDALKAQYAKEVGAEKANDAAHPIAALSGEVAGALNPAGLANKVIGGVSKIGGMVADTIPAAAQGYRALNFAGRVAKGAAEGAAGAGLITAGQNKVLENTGFQNPGEGPSAVDAMKFGGKVGAGIAAAPDVISTGVKLGSWAGKKAMSTILGPSVEAIEARMGPNGAAIKGAQSVKEIKDGIDKTMADFFDNVEKSNMSHAEAKQALSEINQRVRDATNQANFDFRVNHADVNDHLKMANEMLDRSFGAEKAKLAAIKSPIQMADDVQTAMGDLKKKVAEGSDKSYEILGKQKGRADLSGVQDQIEKMKESLHTGEGSNKVLLSSDAEKAHAALEKWQTKLHAIADENGTVPFPVLKDAVKEIDRDMRRYGNKMNPGEFNGLAETQMFGLRKAVDSNLKHIPEYAQHMEGVASNADLLSKANEHFGDAKSTVSKLNQIGGRTAGESRDILNKLGQATENDFSTPVKHFTDAQSRLSNPDAILEGLPEQKAARMAQAAKEQMQRPETKEAFVSGQLERAGLPSKQQEAEKALEAARSKAELAKDATKEFRNLTPTGTQGAVESQMRPTDKENFEIRKQLERVSKISGNDFLKHIDNRRLANQFKGEYRSGSRNVNIGKTIGGGIGLFLGGYGGAAAGAVAGASAGGVIDRFGPMIAGKITDALRNAKGPEIIDRISNLNIPQEAKRAVLREINQFAEKGPIGPLPKAADGEMDKSSGTSSQYKVPAKGPDKWANDGFENLVKHGASDLDREKLMSDPKMKQILINASDLKPGSKALDKLLGQLKSSKKENK